MDEWISHGLMYGCSATAVVCILMMASTTHSATHMIVNKLCGPPLDVDGCAGAQPGGDGGRAGDGHAVQSHSLHQHEQQVCSSGILMV